MLASISLAVKQQTLLLIQERLPWEQEAKTIGNHPKANLMQFMIIGENCNCNKTLSFFFETTFYSSFT